MKHEQPLLVALRLRPMNGAEYRAGAKLIAQTVDNNLVVLLDPFEDPDDILRANRSREKKYVFDFAFDQLASQEDVYVQTTKNLVGDVLRGFNVTVFAYGPTGTGKTYTMLGTANDMGIMVLALNDLFNEIKANEDECMYHVTMSYLEIYNEMIRDLLNSKSGILDLREGVTGETVVAGLREVETTSTTEVMKLLYEGNQRRTTEPTAANRTSSRSHAILKVTVKQRSRTMDVTQEVRTGRLFMVDLAGSERAAVTKNRGQRMVEGAHINRSLLALSNCINALVMGQGRDSHYINYRDSKLTRLLKESLGGNCRTVMIAHLSPASTSYEESRNTLLYAERAKHIKTRVHQNLHDVSYHVTQYHAVISELRKKIAQLQERLAHCQCTPGSHDTVAVDEMCQKLTELFAEQKDVREGICALQYNMVQNAIETHKLLMAIAEWQMKQLSAATATSDPMKKDQTEESASTEAQPHGGGAGEVEEVKETHKLEQGATGSVLSVNEITLTSHELMEPTEVAQARAELATLVADKQRMEAHQRRLQRKLQASNKQVEEIQEELSKLVQLPHQQKGLQTVCEHHELQSSTLDYSLAAAVASLRVSCQDSSMSELQKQCTSALDLLDKQWTLMKMHGVTTPSPMVEELQRLRVKQSLLELQVSADRKLATKIASELPSTAHFSAKLNMTLVSGSKSNLLEEETNAEQQEELATAAISLGHQQAHSGLQLPKLTPNCPLVAASWSNTTVNPLAAITHSMQHDTVTHEPVSLPTLFSPTTTDTFKFSQEVGHKASAFVARSYNSLPVLQRASKGIKPHKPLLAKVASFASPQISASQRSGHKQRRKKYVVPMNHSKKDRILDIESVKTTSVSSLATMKSSTAARRREPIGRKGYTSRKDARDMPPQVQPKLSQATRNRLREARTVITSNEAVTSSRLSVSTQSTPYHTRSLHHQPAARTGTEVVKKASNNNNSGPRRKPAAAVAATGRGGVRQLGRVEGGGPKERLQTRLVPSRVTIGDSKFTSPYFSSPVPQHKKNSKQSHNKRK